MTAPTEAGPIYIPAGSWIRERLLPRTFRRGKPRVAPEWWGAWHLATGDMEWEPHWRHMRVRARCGHGVTTEGRDYADFVIADSVPAVDVCRKCAHLAGITLPERGREDWRGRAAARIVADATLDDAEGRRRLRMLRGAVSPA